MPITKWVKYTTCVRFMRSYMRQWKIYVVTNITIIIYEQFLKEWNWNFVFISFIYSIRDIVMVVTWNEW